MSAARNNYVRDDGVSSIDPTTRRKAWASSYISRGKGAPAYGSPEWCALPDGPQKVAAVVRAAECWATDGDDLTHRLRAELDDLPHAHKRAEDAEYVSRARAHAKKWKGGRYHPDADDQAEVVRDWREWVKADVTADQA